MGKNARFIKGQKYALLSHKENCKAALERTSRSLLAAKNPSIPLTC